MEEALPTYFAPAERASFQELDRQVALFRENPLIGLFDSVTDLVLILNSHRQIIHINQNFMDLLEISDVSEVKGMRPGELFRCENTCDGVGCGTSKGCRNCGAVKAIMCALHNERAFEECRITKTQGERVIAYDLKVCGSPLEIENELFVVFAINDISHEKRRRALERIFFHDILNTAGGLRNLAQMVLEEVPVDLKDETLLLHRFSSELVDEIMAHKVLLAAETEELSVNPQPFDPVELLQSVLSFYENNEVGRGKKFSLSSASFVQPLVSDAALLRRVLSNMVKNALEATPQGGRISLGCQLSGDDVVFSVHNAGVISSEAQGQVFQRSFSTKGSGRGLGTYSMRILVQNYLKGTVEFVSNESNGTEFLVRLPKQLMHSQAS